MTQVYEGETATIVEEFLNEWDEPVMPREHSAAPTVRLFDVDKSIIAEVTAVNDPQSGPGSWRADLPIPNMDLRDSVTLIARWHYEGEDGTYTAKTKVVVDPSSEGRDEDIVIVCGHDSRMQVSPPIRYKAPKIGQKANLATGQKAVEGKPGDELTVSLYFNNRSIIENKNVESPDVKVEKFKNKTLIDMPAVVGKPQMHPLSMLIRHKPVKGLTVNTYTYKVWAVTPQILVAARQLEDFINKARIANIIPELEYTQSDLMECLSRGLSYFNSLQPNVTNFTGTNMQGPLLNAWLVCSTQYALGAQIQAEGALGFDFGGQTVSLNIDRTPAIESALGRIDAEIEGMVKPLKKLLGRAGALGGDGSIGGQYIDGSRNFGVLGLSNTPMTRLPYRRSSWMRSFF